MSIQAINEHRNPTTRQESNSTSEIDLRIQTVRGDSPLSRSPSISRQAESGSPSSTTTPRQQRSWQRNSQSPSVPPGTPSYLSEYSEIDEGDLQIDFYNQIPRSIIRCHSAPPETSSESKSPTSGTRSIS